MSPYTTVEAALGAIIACMRRILRGCISSIYPSATASGGVPSLQRLLEAHRLTVAHRSERRDETGRTRSFSCLCSILCIMRSVVVRKSMAFFRILPPLVLFIFLSTQKDFVE